MFPTRTGAYLTLFFLVSWRLAAAAEPPIETAPIVIRENHSQSENLDPISTFKAEKVAKRKFKEPQRQTLADLVRDQVGVEAQSYCANCGAKRLTINGLKGEHTSILVDGLPLHSAVSSFYGMDSIPITGISSVDVLRGAGASLTNPEAIGGSIYLHTVDPLIPKTSAFTSLQANDQATGTGQNHSFLVSRKLPEQNIGLSIGGQLSRQEAWDQDKNHVAESPYRETKSFLLKTRWQPAKRTDITARLGISQLNILGGAMGASKPDRVRPIPALQTDFIDGRVDREFVGDSAKITDWVDLKRLEGAVHMTQHLSESTTLSWNSGFARQQQSAIYQHGFDYAHIDNLFVSDLSVSHAANDRHFLKTGVFYKDQKLRSASEVLFEQYPAGDTRDIPKDNFNHSSTAIYAQDTWTVNDTLEMDFALRADHLRILWTELTNKIDEWVFAPRFQVRHAWSEHWSQRFSYGLGYRSPLTFFESQHGNNEYGYQVDITKLEKADSLVYSLSHNTPSHYVTLGAHYTRIHNMAYGYEQLGQPILYRNSDESSTVWATDVSSGVKIKPWWFVELSYENFRYPDNYTRKLPTAAIQDRIQWRSTIEHDNWSQVVSVQWVGGRDLSRFGNYNDHYVDRQQFPSPERRGEELKRQRAPAFFTVDALFTRTSKKGWSVSFGATNIFAETQTRRGDSPATWHWHFDHSHYDGLHTWGPNRGREFIVKLGYDL